MAFGDLCRHAAAVGMLAAGGLLLLAAWTIPFALEALLALFILHAGLVLAGWLRGPKSASAFVLIMALLIVALPGSAAAWSNVDRVLHVCIGMILVALGLGKLASSPQRAGVAA